MPETYAGAGGKQRLHTRTLRREPPRYAGKRRLRSVGQLQCSSACRSSCGDVVEDRDKVRQGWSISCGVIHVVLLQARPRAAAL